MAFLETERGFGIVPGLSRLPGTGKGQSVATKGQIARWNESRETARGSIGKAGGENAHAGAC